MGRRRTATRHGNVYRSVREKQGIVVYQQRVLQTVTSLRVVSLVSRGHDLLKSANINPQQEATLLINFGYQQDDLRKLYLLPFEVTKEVKLSMFQYKIIHNILCTNIFLVRLVAKKFSEQNGLFFRLF